ncbi:hypothetical protein AB7W42_22795 [Providencia rettgeri]
MRSARRLAAVDLRVFGGRPAQTKSRFPMKKVRPARLKWEFFIGTCSRYMV